MDYNTKIMLLQTAGLLIAFITLVYFIYWMARKSWGIWESLDKIEKRVAKSNSIIELEECVIEIENLNLFHISHHQEVQKIMAMIKVKMQYLN